VIVSPERRLVPFPGGRAVLRAVDAAAVAAPHALPAIRHGARGDELAELERATMEARRALEEAVVAAAVAAQRAIEVAAALDETLAALSAEGVEASQPLAVELNGTGLESLSPREREVLALVAEGRSNKAIADALFVSPNTVKTHVASLLSKLRAESRAQLAAIAARSGELATSWGAP
jgi:DNA-binding NarL/FixJ family response regulator